MQTRESCLARCSVSPAGGEAGHGWGGGALLTGPPPEARPALALAVSSSHVSTVSQADRRSDSPNSYFFDQPRGAYRKRSWMMAWNQASRKYRRARSLGD